MKIIRTYSCVLLGEEILSQEKKKLTQKKKSYVELPGSFLLLQLVGEARAHHLF